MYTVCSVERQTTPEFEIIVSNTVFAECGGLISSEWTIVLTIVAKFIADIKRNILIIYGRTWKITPLLVMLKMLSNQ